MLSMSPVSTSSSMDIGSSITDPYDIGTFRGIAYAFVAGVAFWLFVAGLILIWFGW